MGMLKNLKTSRKLALLILISILGLVTVGYTGYVYLFNKSREMESMYRDRLIPIKQINENRAFARTIDYLVLNIILTDNPGLKKEYMDQIAATSKAFSENLKNYEESSMSSFEKEKINYIRQQLTDARPSRLAVFEFIAQNQNQEAYKLFVEKNQPATENITQALMDLAEYNAKVANDIHVQSIQEFEHASFIFISLILGAAIILVFSGWAIARAIVVPLAVTVSKVEGMGDGDLTGSIPAELLSAQDETGQLSRAFNKTNANIRNLIEKISETSEQLAAASVELTVGSEQSTNAADDIAGATGDVAKGAEKQLKIVEKTVHAAEKISAEAEQIYANADTVAAASNKTAESAVRGQKTVETAIDQMASIQNTVENLAREITGLGMRSQEIGQIVEAISAIAGQTNLLALNAAIEAARAGEQGRGFAVVAEEVRKLAEQSHEAAKRISDLIGAIQSETNNAVRAMEAGTREVKTGAELIDNAGAVFQEIASLINQTSSQAREISESIRQMAEDSQIIVSGVQDLSATSKDVAEQTMHVSAATQEQTTSLQKIAAASNALSKRAEDLQGMVQKFVI